MQYWFAGAAKSEVMEEEMLGTVWRLVGYLEMRFLEGQGGGMRCEAKKSCARNNRSTA